MHPPPLDFAVIGAPKCGTTWFTEALARHPHVCFGRHKDAGPLATDFVGDGVDLADPATYRSWFERCEGAARVGESAVRYLYSDRALEALATLDRPPVVFVLVRDPLEQIPSYHGQLRAVGAQPEPDLRSAWRASTEHPGTPLDYRFVGDVAARIRRWDTRFGDRVRIVRMGELRDRPEGVLRRAAEALEIDPEGFEAAPPTDARTRNAHTAARSFRLARWVRRPPAPLRAVARALMPASLRARTAAAANRWNDRPAERRPPPDDLLEEMAEAFAPSVEWLEARLGRPLPGWCGRPVE